MIAVRVITELAEHPGDRAREHLEDPLDWNGQDDGAFSYFAPKKGLSGGRGGDGGRRRGRP
jgi:hypothetical protein